VYLVHVYPGKLSFYVLKHFQVQDLIHNLDAKRNMIYLKNFWLLILLVFAIYTSSFAQSPYELSYKKDIPLLTVSFIGTVGALYYDFNVIPLTSEQIADRVSNPNDINRFDRRAIKSFSGDSQIGSDILLTSSYVFPFLFLLDQNSRRDYVPVGIIGAEVILINGSLTAITKGFAKRARPFVYNPNVDIALKMEKNAKLSFYSGHTSVTSSMCFFSAKVFNDYHPDSKWKPVVWSAAAIIPAAVGYLRVKAGKHFPTDVITGYIAGGLVGYFIPEIHRKKDKEAKVGFKIYPGPTSLGMTMTW